MKLYTIGFTQKSAETFFELLRDHRVGRMIDIRLRPDGQLSAFARKEDLPYFLRELANGCDYVHLPELAPTNDILKDYRSGGDWSRYVEQFERLMEERGIPDKLNRALFESADCCLLCSEATPEQCHRRLVAERIAGHWPEVEIIHL
jgi:uncharacterized protein (DUF488 family)